MHHIRNGAARQLLGALLCSVAVTACQPGPESPTGEPEVPEETGSGESPVVYGTDDRFDVYAHANATLRQRAEQSTVALMSPDMLDTSNPDDVGFYAYTLGEYENLCNNQRFWNDPAAAWCSGTLIDDDLVLTAGHCVENAADCADTRFVFNYYNTGADTLQKVTTADIFSCKAIVTRRLDSGSGSTNLDYAIIRLDRSAAPRFTPAPVRSGNTALTAGEGVAVIGSGSGIPFKIDSGGKVRTARASTLDYFVATTDTFAGNSGSGVYETANHTLAGILVRGDEDYVRSGSCYVVNNCPETGCGGEEITYVQPAITAFCKVATSTRLCGTTQPPTGGSTFTFSAQNTYSATVNTTHKTVALTAGQKITVGTCGVPDATVVGDSYLRLFGPSGLQVAENDDACNGRGSQLSFTATAAGTYEVRAGCYDTTTCSGTVAWKLEGGGSTPAPTSGTFDFSATATNSARTGTTNQDVTLTAGQSLSFGTCSMTGASGTGDTFLRLYNSAGQQVTSNDDACGSLSHATYTVPAGAGGTYQIRAGCYGATTCSGTVAWTLR
ncbi:trypsin-like peptidase domain-containing protein [Myxococcus faecalis]|jgi:V8-like Glu-specific endopeptidase|uniref:trypsin-like peptidase domain-containing protein n=1 Tax=Myxococcus faecalis TaxID=3115646 RepID=UPI0038D20158